MSTRGILSLDHRFIVSVVAYSASNRPDVVPKIAREAVEKVGPSIFPKLREALVKTAPLVGFPRTINSLREMSAVAPKECMDVYARASDATVDTQKRGREYFGKTYGKVTQRVLDSMTNSSLDLANLAIDYAYGKVLSYSGVISPLETSFVIIAALIPLDVNPQLRGHLKGALNHGASREEVMEVRSIALDIARQCGIQLTTVESL
ncbi:fungal protein [Schizosaccharomyces japonicus yFS275]|uniref:Fungal protein n=1 Tax=Schizosaccharomyces japonicus (strain yFS275 / FY16936) TaxID=402676 RepID=B6K0S1_SCHJY|nr:fungal protein [Schizosaccharomyces japonicus yFS275]EEB07542.1 fungal protein [Schizosaccharomyces japonicus yFS275]